MCVRMDHRRSVCWFVFCEVYMFIYVYDCVTVWVISSVCGLRCTVDHVHEAVLL